jgi:RNA polymerase sigma-70 factor (ECF subfamily)
MIEPVLEAEAAGRSLDDREVVRRVLAGEAKLFEALVVRHDQRLYRAARSVLRDDDEAQDALQAAWISIYTHLDQLQPETVFAAWATRIVVNESLQRLRAARRRSGLHAVGSPPPAPPAADQRASAREAARVVEAAIDALAPQHRMVLVLRDVEGLSVAETAASLDASVEVVKKRHQRARRALREAVLARAGEAAAEVFAFRGARCEAMARAVMAYVLAAPDAAWRRSVDPGKG